MGAAAVQKSGVEVPFEAPEEALAEIEPMEQDGAIGTTNIDDPRVVQLDKKIEACQTVFENFTNIDAEQAAEQLQKKRLAEEAKEPLLQEGV